MTFPSKMLIEDTSAHLRCMQENPACLGQNGIQMRFLLRVVGIAYMREHPICLGQNRLWMGFCCVLSV